jgi:hypothetical protein
MLSIRNNVFPDFLLGRGEDPNFEMYDDDQLAASLRQLYCCVRTKDGRSYSRSGYRNLRSGLQRHLVSAPYNRKIDLRGDRKFQSANQVYDGKLKELKSEGRDITVHKKAISEMDMKQMYESAVFSTQNPIGLQRKVFFEVSLHFGRRGREGWRGLKKNSFVIAQNTDGLRYVTLCYNELDKNHQNAEEKDQYMFQLPGDKNCPVASFEKYLSKLNPKCEAFLQRPDAKFRNRDTWYVNAPLGVHTISNMMKAISEEAGTSHIYTNHCIKATTGTVLKKAGFATQDIMCVTGHKNVASLNSYVAKPDTNERAVMSNALAIFGKADQKELSASVTTTSMVPHNRVVPANSTVLNVSNTIDNNVNLDQRESSLFSGAHFHGSVIINVNYTST